LNWAMYSIYILQPYNAFLGSTYSTNTKVHVAT